METSGISFNPTKRSDGFDWDLFWQFTSRQKLANKLLYAYHFRHYCKLLNGLLPPQPYFLELGAGSGVLPRKIIKKWGGSAVLVDSNDYAHQIFKSKQVVSEPIEYVISDVRELSLPSKFDLVFSDGLIEHFPDKNAVMEAHLKAMKDDGWLMIFVPHDSFLFRNLTKMGPDMGYEERYSLSALKRLCENYGLEVIRETKYFFEVGVLCRKKTALVNPLS